jgi:hypothetical protein
MDSFLLIVNLDSPFSQLKTSSRVVLGRGFKDSRGRGEKQILPPPAGLEPQRTPRKKTILAYTQAAMAITE